MNLCLFESVLVYLDEGIRVLAAVKGGGDSEL